MKLRNPKPSLTPFPLGYDVNARYEFHSEALGHKIKNYRVLKYKMQDLIDSKAITFTQNGLDILNNPMPPHADTTAIP